MTRKTQAEIREIERVEAIEKLNTSKLKAYAFLETARKALHSKFVGRVSEESAIAAARAIDRYLPTAVGVTIGYAQECSIVFAVWTDEWFEGACKDQQQIDKFNEGHGTVRGRVGAS